MKNAKDVSALKAVSQNLMHENLTVTDGVYGILSDSDVRKQIIKLADNKETIDLITIEQLVQINQELLNHLKQTTAVSK